MKRLYITLSIVTVGLLLTSCTKGFLSYNPKASLSEDQLNTPDRVDKMVTSAYASLGNADWETSSNTQWPMGSVRAEDSYKGGGGIPDQGEWNTYATFTNITTDMGKANQMWVYYYEGIGRANTALKLLRKLSGQEFPKKKEREAEVRFIRAHYYFNLKILFKHIPWVDAKTSQDSLKYISNRKYSSQELWDKIASDFQFAADNLPPTQAQVGRVNKYAAIAYLAKVRLYQAYEQDDQNNVVNINKNRLQDVIDLTNKVINSGQYGLFDDFAKNFLWKYENGKEGVFEIQNSIDDGTPTGRLGTEYGLNYNMDPKYGCCSFNQPSQNMVNAFKTNSDGLPEFDTYNDSDLHAKDSTDFRNNTVDPRLDHTVGIPGHPFKYDPQFIDKVGWARTPSVYGYFSPMKEIQLPSSPSFKAYGPFFASSKNYVIIRYADVLLWKAEALIKLGRQNEALPIINKIRSRAKHSKDRLRYENGDYVSNYHIETYKPGTNINWTQKNAFEALRWERRLEFAGEGVRFFDLVRWGITAEKLNAYFKEEMTKRDYLRGAHFTKNRDEYLPIPQQQINFSKGLYKQNPGW